MQECTQHPELDSIGQNDAGPFVHGPVEQGVGKDGSTHYQVALARPV